jgi:iron complex transport system substrate-binding protein
MFRCEPSFGIGIDDCCPFAIEVGSAAGLRDRAPRAAIEPAMNRRAFVAALLASPWVAGFASATARSGVHVFGQPPERVTRVFASGNPASVLAYVLAPQSLLGWPMQLAAEALALLAPPARELPVLGRLSGRGSTVSLERLLGLKPDLILDVGTVDGTTLSSAEQVHARTGIPYVLLAGQLADSAQQLRNAGMLLGTPERAEELARYAQASLLPCAKAVRKDPPRVYLARGADGLETALPGSVNGEIIDTACGLNVAAAAGGGNVARVSLEQVLAWQPDFIVTQDASFHAAASRDPVWRGLAAVTERRLLLAPSLPFGWLEGPPSVNRLIGVRWLHAHLHGIALPADWAHTVAGFHRLFYGQAPSAEQLARLIRGDG